MIFTHNCQKHSHQYEARYDLSAAPQVEVTMNRPEDVIRVIEAFKSKTYVHDICVKCGDIKMRAGHKPITEGDIAAIKANNGYAESRPMGEVRTNEWTDKILNAIKENPEP